MADKPNHTTHDTAMGFGMLGLVLLGVGYLIWRTQEYNIKNMFRWVRWSEMWVVSLFVDDKYTVTVDGKVYNFKDSMDMLGSATPKQLDGYYSLFSLMAMEALKWPMLGLLAAMALWAYTKGPKTQYRRKMGLEGLIGAQAQNFPIISPFIKFNPSKQKQRAPGTPVPAELPLFAEALGPEEWLAYNQIPIPDGRVSEYESYLAFARQLGPRWRGTKQLLPYKQVLLAAFCLKAARKRKESDEMLGRLAACWDSKKSLQLGRDRKLLNDARKVLRNNGLAGKTLAVCNQHAFETTALLRALLHARSEGGVLAPAQFVWLRGHDRLLWYALNNLGRQAFHMEALGAMSHFKAERLTQRPIPKPKVDNAIGTIAKYIASPRARPIPQLDYSESKNKRGVKKPAAKKPAGKKTPKKA